jgi:hypothetical protein
LRNWRGKREFVDGAEGKNKEYRIKKKEEMTRDEGIHPQSACG